MSLIEFFVDEKIGPMIIFNISHYQFVFCFCHRMKDRSIWFFGLERWFCSRCLGILLGGGNGMLLALMNIRFPFYWMVLLMIPLIIDGFSQASGYRKSTNILRFLTGFLFGCALPPIVVIFRDFIRSLIGSVALLGPCLHLL
jgi:uncharacterized membrane protein